MGFLGSVAVSVLATVLFAPHGDDLGIGFLWILIFLPIASLLIPLSLGVTGELIQRKVLGYGFAWSKALLRSLIALPAAIGPLYAATCVAPYVESRRPTHWAAKEVLLYGLSVAFVYLALRIKRRPLQTPVDSGELLLPRDSNAL
jgi:hypothetical protein